MKLRFITLLCAMVLSGSAAADGLRSVSLGAEKITCTKEAGTNAYPSHFLTIDLGVLNEGDVIDVDAMIILNKGDEDGDALALIRSSADDPVQAPDEAPGVLLYEPDGRVLFHMGTVDLEWRGYMPARTRIQQPLRGIGRVTSTGTVKLRFLSSSANSPSTSGPSQTQIRVWKYR